MDPESPARFADVFVRWMQQEGIGKEQKAGNN